MTIFTIDSDNNITAWQEPPTETAGRQAFATADELIALTADWPGTRLVEIWNSLAGVVPVKRFTSRSLAVTRIWKQIQHLVPAAAPKPNAKAQRPAVDAATAREGSKKAHVLELVRRPDGATLDEIMRATDWQAHTVRGFLSGAITKKMGLTVESFRGEDKVRVYRVVP